MTTKKLKDAKSAASKTADTTPKAAPKKAPSKAELRRQARAKSLTKAKRRVKDLKKAKSEQAWIDTECGKIQGGDQASLTLGVFMNERYQDDCGALGFIHWTLLAEENILSTVKLAHPNDFEEKETVARDLLRRIEWDLSRIQKSLHDAYIAGKGGSENTAKDIGKIRDKAYSAVFGAKPPRRPQKGPYNTLINAGKAAYKRLVNLEAQTEAQAKDASVIGGMLTHFKVDLTKINVNGNG